MKYHTLFMLIMTLIPNITYACNDKITAIINDDSWADTFRGSLKERYKAGPNFNNNDYVFTYPCGGGAICGNIFDSKENNLIDFPSEFIIDSSPIEFNVSYNIESNKICFSGESAYDQKTFNNQCYNLISGELVILE